MRQEPVRDIHHSRLGRQQLALAITALAAALATTACGGSSASSSTAPKSPRLLDTHTVELAVETSILNQRHITVTVTCPQTVTERTGNDFTCVATRSASKIRTPIAVVQQNDRGYVTYRVK